MPGRSAVRYVAAVSLFTLAVAVVTGAVGCDPESAPRAEIRDWHDLNAVRDQLGGSFILMNDLDATVAGYEELASARANDKKGWRPIGSSEARFTGSLDGQGYEIRGLFINRPAESFVGLFGTVGEGGVVRNVGVDAIVSGEWSVGGLLGANWGTVRYCYSVGSVSGDDYVGGLLGGNAGTLSNSYSTASVIGRWDVGGLLGANDLAGAVIDCYGDRQRRWRVVCGWPVGRQLGRSCERMPVRRRREWR
ncbi:MAG: GLUG motif-containing protein [Dehalococcoidia bacterium]